MGFPISTEIKLKEPQALGEFSGHGIGILVGSERSAAGAPGANHAVEGHRGGHRQNRMAPTDWDPTDWTPTDWTPTDWAPPNKVAVPPVRLGIGRGSRWIAVAGGLGYFPVAPGTAGSLGGVLLFLLAMNLGVGVSRASFIASYVLAVALLFVLGTRAAGRAEVDFGRRDDGRIVIDEVVGQMIAFLPLTLWTGGDLLQIFPHVVTGFVLFRLFDVWKPGAVRWAERRFKGGLGVMADDVVAGLYAGVVLAMGLILFGSEYWISSADSLSSLSSMASRVWA